MWTRASQYWTSRSFSGPGKFSFDITAIFIWALTPWIHAPCRYFPLFAWWRQAKSRSDILCKLMLMLLSLPVFRVDAVKRHPLGIYSEHLHLFTCSSPHPWRTAESLFFSRRSSVFHRTSLPGPRSAPGCLWANIKQMGSWDRDQTKSSSLSLAFLKSFRAHDVQQTPKSTISFMYWYC